MNPSPTPADFARRAAGALRDGRRWQALGYLGVELLWTLMMFVVAIVALSVSLALCLVGVGIPLTVWSLGGIVRLAGGDRRRAAWVGVSISPRSLVDGSIMKRFRDTGRWRHAGYALSAWFVTGLATAAAIAVWGSALFMISLPIWGWVLDSTSWPEMVGLCLAGVGVLALAPFVTTEIASLLARFTEAAVGPDRTALLEQRVSELDRHRSEILTAVADERRRIERNLHDGVQQQLVAMGIDVGLAETKVESDPVAAVALLKDAQSKARSSIGELRTIGRGLHPAILGDRGLDAALSALTSNAKIPATVACELTVNPPAQLQEAAYFVASEAMANVLKHSHAREAVIDVRGDGRELTVSVYDDGRGGATLSGTGLAGIAARVRGMDGTFDVSSPEGGPTRITAVLPYPPGAVG